MKDIRKTFGYIGAAFVAVLLMASCSTQFSIKGTSDVSMLDGHKLYLRAQSGDDVKNIDSCEVVHGKFQFHGQIDTTKVGGIFLDGQNLLPVVLEEGELEIAINAGKQSCVGSPLNEKLSDFIEKYNQLTNQIADLQHQHDKAIMDGEDMNEVNERLQKKAAELSEQEEKLITTFIEENFDNVLAPFAFQMVTSDMQYPMFTPWIEALLSKATDTFKNDKYVSEFVKVAERNRDIMTGMQ